MSAVQNPDEPHRANESSCGSLPQSSPQIVSTYKKDSRNLASKNSKALLIALLLVFLLASTKLYSYTALVGGSEEILVILPANRAVGLTSGIPSKLSLIEVHINGHLIPKEMVSQYAKTPLLSVQIQKIFYRNNKLIKDVQNLSSVWQLELLASNTVPNEMHESRIFDLVDQSARPSEIVKLRVRLQTANLDHAIPLKVSINFKPITENVFVTYGLIALACLHLMMLSGVMNYTFSTTVAACALIGFIGAVRVSPSFWTTVSWVHFESLTMLFAAMVLFGVLAECGITSFWGNCALKRTKGDPWAANVLLSLIAVWFSAFYDEPAAVMPAAQIAAHLSERMQLNLRLAFISIAAYSNLGSCLSPLALELPQEIIQTFGIISGQNLSHQQFYVHLLLCILNVCVTVHTLLSFTMPSHVGEASNDGAANQRELKTNKTIGELRCKIHNPSLLILSMVAIGLAFFLYAMDLSPKGWSIALGLMFMLMVVDQRDMMKVITYVDWSLLLYIAAFRVLTHSLTRIGAFNWVSSTIVDLLFRVDVHYRLVVAVVVVLWTSALLAALVGKILSTKVMAGTVMQLVNVELLELPLTPLLLATLLGASFGANGSLVGMPTNVLCVEAAQRQKCKITAFDYFKIGFPMMLSSLASATIYLIFSYGLFAWD